MRVVQDTQERYTVHIVTHNKSAWDFMSYGLCTMDRCKNVAKTIEPILERGFTVDEDDDMAREFCDDMVDCGIELATCHVEIAKMAKAGEDAPHGWRCVWDSRSANFRRK